MEKLAALIDIMATISYELSETDFGKNPMGTDIEKLVRLYTRWLLVIDDAVSLINKSLIKL